jgi:hypothetical protein
MKIVWVLRAMREAYDAHDHPQQIRVPDTV